MRSFIHSLVHRPAELLFCNRYRAKYGGFRKKEIRSSPALGSKTRVAMMSAELVSSRVGTPRREVSPAWEAGAEF